MKTARFLAIAILFCGIALPAGAQTPPPEAAAEKNAESGDQVPLVLPATPAPDPRGLRLFASDFKHFFSKDTAQVLGVMALASVAAVPWDRQAVDNGFNFSTRNLRYGNTVGRVYYQAAAGLALYGVGASTGHSKLANFGRDVVRAQLLSQTMVQGVKLAVHRERPDGSNHYSFPSGHSASAFATAAVVHRHYGWKAGIPAYAVGAYVASARMAWNKHHISDVIMGAGFGLAAGRTVTMEVAKSRFTMGVAPTVGGAQITVSKQ